MQNETYDVILLDMNFQRGKTEGSEGIHWLESIKKQDPRAVVILMTVFAAFAIGMSIDRVSLFALIFSIGILAMLGMQTIGMRNTIEAKYRSEASYLAAQIVGTMWALLVACTGYYGLMDLGIRSAVGQYVTRYWAKDDIDGVSHNWRNDRDRQQHDRQACTESCDEWVPLAPPPRPRRAAVQAGGPRGRCRGPRGRGRGRG